MSDDIISEIKCKDCADKNHRDSYICKNECPYNDDGTLKEVNGNV